MYLVYVSVNIGVTVTVADVAGNTYPSTPTEQTAVQSFEQEYQVLFLVPSIKGASANTNTVKATYSGPNYFPGVAVFEYSGLNTSGQPDALNENGNFPTTSLSISASASASNDTYVLMVFPFSTDGEPATFTGGTTTRYADPQGNFYLGDQVFSSAGSHTMTATVGSTTYTAILAALR